MSALGRKRTFAPQKVMSALTPKADICSALAPACERRPYGSRHCKSFRSRNHSRLKSLLVSTAGRTLQLTSPGPPGSHCASHAKKGRDVINGHASTEKAPARRGHSRNLNNGLLSEFSKPVLNHAVIARVFSSAPPPHVLGPLDLVRTLWSNPIEA